MNFAAINPANAFKGFAGARRRAALAAGAAGIGIFFAFWSWVGWEMAPNYGEESRNPKRNVPRALYISVIGLGVFYTLTSWAGITGYHSINAAAKVAQTNAANFYFLPAHHFAGSFLQGALSWFIITGSFACGMAFHNTTARYMYSLGRERVLPAALGRTHQKFKSAWIASLTQSGIAALILLAFALFAVSNAKLGAGDSVGYLQVYGLMAVMGVISILAIQALVSVAIFSYFRSHYRAEHHWWSTITAPIIATVTQAIVLYLALKNLHFLGSGYSYAKWLAWGDLADLPRRARLCLLPEALRPRQVRDRGAHDQPGARQSSRRPKHHEPILAGAHAPRPRPEHVPAGGAAHVRRRSHFNARRACGPGGSRGRPRA